jgi:DNA adenine methylase
MKYSLFPALELSQPRARPFLKWAGGKRQILKELLRLLPSDVKDRTYREPFLGGGSLFFALNPATAFLSDVNEHLIMAYEYVRDCPDLVSDYLCEHRKNDCPQYYYQVREVYNKSKSQPSAAQTARFIYLNKTCYNGVFRVNTQGLFNVPYGRYETVSLPSRDHLREVSTVLQSKQVFVASFEEALDRANKGDFIYLDPPYPPRTATSYFTHYTCDKFSEKDQEKLAGAVRTLDAAGCLVMISNGNSEKILELYNGFNVHRLEVTRFITCKKIRDKVQELLITNY